MSDLDTLHGFRDTDRVTDIGQHSKGRRFDVLGHACPECGPDSHNLFCPWCYGTGLVETHVLARWQHTQNEANR
jgi:hypothetical protein